MEICCPSCGEKEDIVLMLKCEEVKIKEQSYRFCFYRCANCTKRFGVESNIEEEEGS